MVSETRRFKMLIHSPGSIKYRDNPIKQTIYNFSVKCDGRAMAVSQYLDTLKWWIVPSENNVDHLVEAHGPFETAEDAMTQIYLMGDVKGSPTILDPDGDDHDEEDF